MLHPIWNGALSSGKESQKETNSEHVVGGRQDSEIARQTAQGETSWRFGGFSRSVEDSPRMLPSMCAGVQGDSVVSGRETCRNLIDPRWGALRTEEGQFVTHHEHRPPWQVRHTVDVDRCCCSKVDRLRESSRSRVFLCLEAEKGEISVVGTWMAEGQPKVWRSLWPLWQRRWSCPSCCHRNRRR